MKKSQPRTAGVLQVRECTCCPKYGAVTAFFCSWPSHGEALPRWSRALKLWASISGCSWSRILRGSGSVGVRTPYARFGVICSYFSTFPPLLTTGPRVGALLLHLCRDLLYHYRTLFLQTQHSIVTTPSAIWETLRNSTTIPQWQIRIPGSAR